MTKLTERALGALTFCVWFNLSLNNGKVTDVLSVAELIYRLRLELADGGTSFKNEDLAACLAINGLNIQSVDDIPKLVEVAIADLQGLIDGSPLADLENALQMTSALQKHYTTHEAIEGSEKEDIAA